MIAVDTNLLVYAHRGETPFHEAASRALADLIETGAQWAIPWPCVHEFLAVVTNARIFKPPTPVNTALEATRRWLDSPTLITLAETERHWNQLVTIVAAGRVAGPMVHDARIAALCLEHGVTELWTADRDFSRFPQLKVRNPLVAR